MLSGIRHLQRPQRRQGTFHARLASDVLLVQRPGEQGRIG
jgi:hypothetical protein